MSKGLNMLAGPQDTLWVRATDVEAALRAYKTEHGLRVVDIAREVDMDWSQVKRMLTPKDSKWVSLKLCDRVFTKLDIPLPEIYEARMVRVA